MNTPQIADDARSTPSAWGRVLDIVGGIPFAAVMLALIFLYSSIGSALPPIRQGALADWLHIEALRFEKSEMQWFSWWPFHLLLGTFCLGLVVATVRHVPMHWNKIGILLAHVGILVIVVSSAIYFGLKKEGDAVIFAARALIVAPGMTAPASLVVRPEARVTVGVAPRTYDVTVARIIPNDRVPAGEDQGETTSSVWLTVRSAQPPRQFTRVLYLGYPAATFDIEQAAQTQPEDMKPKTGQRVDADLQIQLDYDPAEYMYYSHQPPVHSVGAIYARFSPSQEWAQLRLHGLPHYYEHIATPAEISANPDQTLPPPRPMRVSAEKFADADDLSEIDFHVTDYLPYAQWQTRWAPGGLQINPLLRFSLGAGGATEHYELMAFAPLFNHVKLTENLEAHFAWVTTSADREALLSPAPPEIIVHRQSGETAHRIPLSDLAEKKRAAVPDTNYTIGLHQVLPAGATLDGTSPALIILTVERGDEKFFRVVVAGKPQNGPDLDEHFKPIPGSAHEDLELEYTRPASPKLQFIGQPDRDELDVALTLANGSQKQFLVRQGESIELMPGLQAAIRTFAPYTQQEAGPAIVPREQRRSLQQVGKTMSMIRVEVTQNGQTRSAWLPFSNYAFRDKQRAQPERFNYQPTQLPLPDGRTLELLYSRWREPLPAEIALDRFILQTYPGGDRPSDYISLIRFAEGGDWSPITEVRSNEPAHHGDLWYFQAQWDPGTQCHTVLGVANRAGVYGMLAGALISIFGIVWAFYVQPNLSRREQHK